MRTHALVSIGALALLAACSGERAQNASTASPSASPVPLRACETRELQFDDSDVVVAANVDGTVASIVVVHAPSDDVATQAFEDARKAFGEPHPDTRTTDRPNKWGLVQVTDMCGRAVSPTPKQSG